MKAQGVIAGLIVIVPLYAHDPKPVSRIGREVAIVRHLQDDEEFALPLHDLLEFGKKLFLVKTLSAVFEPATPIMKSSRVRFVRQKENSNQLHSRCSVKNAGLWRKW